MDSGLQTLAWFGLLPFYFCLCFSLTRVFRAFPMANLNLLCRAGLGILRLFTNLLALFAHDSQLLLSLR
jgi:hypothetical protein